MAPNADGLCASPKSSDATNFMKSLAKCTRIESAPHVHEKVLIKAKHFTSSVGALRSFRGCFFWWMRQSGSCKMVFKLFIEFFRWTATSFAKKLLFGSPAGDIEGETSSSDGFFVRFAIKLSLIFLCWSDLINRSGFAFVVQNCFYWNFPTF